MKYALRALTSGRASMAGPAAGNAVDLQTLNIAMHCTHTFERHVSSRCNDSFEGGGVLRICGMRHHLDDIFRVPLHERFCKRGPATARLPHLQNAFTQLYTVQVAGRGRHAPFLAGTVSPRRAADDDVESSFCLSTPIGVVRSMCFISPSPRRRGLAHMRFHCFEIPALVRAEWSGRGW